MQSENPQPPVSKTLAPFRNKVFRSIWAATQISSLGWLVQTVAISWLMATISASDLMVALVQAASTLPVFFLSVFAGAIADNFSRRWVMFAGHCLIASASTTLMISVGLGFVSPWLILGLGFLAGCGFALNDPAWHASVGDILHKRDIPAAVTLMSVGYNIVRSVGPALGGVILAVFGPLAAFALAAVSDLAPISAIWRTKWEVRSSPLPRERMTTAIHDGVRFTAMSLEIRAATARAALFGLASISILALLPLVVRDQLKSGPIVYGILLAGFGMGAFIAGMGNGFLRKVTSQNRLVAFASVACAVCCLSLALTSSLPVAAISLALGGAGWLITWTGIDVSVQLASPRWVVGRTLSIYYALSAGGMAAGSWIWGSVAQNYSLTSALEGRRRSVAGCSSGDRVAGPSLGRNRSRKFSFSSAGRGSRSETQKWPYRGQGRVFDIGGKYRGLSGLHAHAATRPEPCRCTKLDAPAKSANTVTLDGDIPHPHLDGLSPPKSSTHRSR